MPPVYKLVVNDNGVLKSLNILHECDSYIYTYTPHVTHKPVVGKFFIFTVLDEAKQLLNAYENAQVELWKCFTPLVYSRDFVLDPYTMNENDVINYWKNKPITCVTYESFTSVCDTIYLEEKLL
jgi:hypothetical protein